MLNTTRITAISILLLLAGCVRSLQPLYTEKDLIFDEKLVGCWSDENPDAKWCFSKQSEKAYRLVVTENGSSGSFDVHLFKIEGKLFMDLLPRQQELNENDFYKFHLLPVHTFLHVKQIEPTLQMRFPDRNWFDNHIIKAPDALQHQMVQRDIIVTATTEEMQTFWLKHLDSKGAFQKFTNLTRAVEVPEQKTNEDK